MKLNKQQQKMRSLYGLEMQLTDWIPLLIRKQKYKLWRIFDSIEIKIV